MGNRPRSKFDLKSLGPRGYTGSIPVPGTKKKEENRGLIVLTALSPFSFLGSPGMSRAEVTPAGESLARRRHWAGSGRAFQEARGRRRDRL